jgi:hypothetical protein
VQAQIVRSVARPAGGGTTLRYRFISHASRWCGRSPTTWWS